MKLSKMIVRNGICSLLILFTLVGCSAKVEEKYEIVTIVNSEGISVPILYHQDSDGDLYYRVLPDYIIMNSEIEFSENYPVDWTLVEKPKSN